MHGMAGMLVIGHDRPGHLHRHTQLNRNIPWGNIMYAMLTLHISTMRVMPIVSTLSPILPVAHTHQAVWWPVKPSVSWSGILLQSEETAGRLVSSGIPLYVQTKAAPCKDHLPTIPGNICCGSFVAHGSFPMIPRRLIVCRSCDDTGGSKEGWVRCGGRAVGCRLMTRRVGCIPGAGVWNTPRYHRQKFLSPDKCIVAFHGTRPVTSLERFTFQVI